MKLTFHGAARTVTGSKHLLELEDGTRFLLDCGMFQGMGSETIALNSHFGFDPATLSAVIISHGHIDHTGLLPRLVKEGFKGRIYCTPATSALIRLLLVDSARIQEADAAYVNRHNESANKPPVKPLYTEEDANAVFPLIETIPYRERYRVTKNVELLYTDCGHILGSAAVHLRIRENGTTQTVTFSGDVGRYRDMILRSPDVFPQADHIIMESTYGNKLHEGLAEAGDNLLRHIEETCLQKKGKLIIAAFSLGRTQELLFLLNRLELEGRLPDLRYIVDSPLSIHVTEVVKRYPDYFNKNVQKLLERDQDVFAFKGLEYTEAVEASMKLNDDPNPCVIIASSGMAEAGRVKHHIANHITDPSCTILLTGYCEPHSLGGRLKQNPEEVGIFGKRFPVKASVAEITGLSAHGDYDDLSQWLACQDPRLVENIFLVHGNYDVQIEFRERLMKKGFRNVEIPSMHQQFQLRIS